MGESLTEFNIANLPLFFGVALYAFEGIGVMFTIKNSMEKPKKFKYILAVNMILLTVIYLFFSVASNAAFKNRTPDVVLLTLPKTAPYLLV